MYHQQRSLKIITFLKEIASKITEDRNKWDTLQTVEIYVIETVEYKSGHLQVFAENSEILESSGPFNIRMLFKV